MTIDEIDNLIKNVKIGDRVFIKTNAWGHNGIISYVTGIDLDRTTHYNLDFRAHCIEIKDSYNLFDIRTMRVLDKGSNDLINYVNKLESELKCLK